MGLNHKAGLSADMLKVYEQLPGMYLILSPDLLMIAASDTYLRTTGKTRADIEGKFIFDVFPNDPVSGIGDSLANVLVSRAAHYIPVVRFDTPNPYFPLQTTEKYWKTEHHPIKNQHGEIDYIIHVTQDVTELVETQKDVAQNQSDLLSLNFNLAQANEEIQAANEELIAINEELGEAQADLQNLNEQLEERVALRTEQLDKSKKHLDFLLNAIPQQIWTAKPDGSLDYVNQVVCNDFGEDAEHIIGQGWRKFIHPDDIQACLETWGKALATATEYVTEFRLQMHNGKYIWHLGRAIPFIEDGEIKLWMGTNTNIDLQKENEQKKDEFISIASHELKTPLTSIKAFNQLMQRTSNAESMSSFLSKSLENILRLEKLIADLLDVTKINAGKMNYTMQAFSFNEMLKETVESQQLIATSHEIILTGSQPIDYYGDRYRIEQVVNNFLTNAVKYAPAGSKILVNASIELNNIVVSVQDFGIGIAEKDLNRLFERYYRVDNTAMQFEGLGLGLFISSEILKRHGGSFWIESELGKGATFFFRLPLDEANAIRPVVKYQDFYKDESITISYNSDYQRLDVDWTGYQNFESVYAGGMLMLEMLKKNRCHKVLNDNRHVLGTWSDAADWAREEWFPMMEQGGLEYFAWIYANSAFSQLAAQKAVDVNMGKVVAQFFTDISLAEEWLNSK
jgi:PAS domain S-box-containing protein